jgi:hypothetical protein
MKFFLKKKPKNLSLDDLGSRNTNLENGFRNLKMKTIFQN